MQAKELELRLRQERALWRSAQLRRDVRQEAQCLAAPLAQVDRLREEFGVYLVRSGRMCVAGLNERNVERK